MWRDRAIALSWEDHRRTRELCDWLGIPLFTLLFDGPRLARYIRLGIATIRLLWRTAPAVVFVQTPSVALALLVVALRRICGGYRIVMDAHNEAVAPYAYTQWPVPLLHRLTLRAADLTIVTNSALVADVERIGGRAHVLPDRLPSPPVQGATVDLTRRPFRVMVVATYAADEPILEIIQAARELGPSFEFRLTGRETRLSPRQRSELPPNVWQTGFLSDADYWQLMRDSHCVLDFTLKPNCLVCGAYEGLALMRPMVLSDNPATRSLFGRVAVLPPTHRPRDIAAAVRECERRYDEIVAEAQLARQQFVGAWQVQAHALDQLVSGWLDSRSVANKNGGQKRARS